MRKAATLGILALTVAITAPPITAEAKEKTDYRTGAFNQVMIWNGNCDVSNIQNQIQDILNNMGNNCISGMPGNNGSEDGNINGPALNPDYGFGDENDNAGNVTEESYAEQVVNLVNVERAKNGLSALSADSMVTQAANVRAVEIQSSFSHTRPNGSKFSTVLQENGVNFRGTGENIAYGQRTPEEVVTGWMNSAGHRANILNENFKNIGVGYQVDSRGTGYWVQLFTY